MSGLGARLSEAFPPRSLFSTDDIPDLTGKVIIVTGASTGIGKETSRVLLTHGAKVYLAARNQKQTEETIRDLKEKTGKEGIFLSLDLANLKAVKRAAETFLSKETQLHVLFNNAGVMIPPVERTTSDGYDLQFGTNVLGHFYFVQLLLPTLIATAKTTPDGKARVVTTSSSVHTSGQLDFDTFKDTEKRRATTTGVLYSQSKLANVLVAKELAQRYSDQGIVSIALNPGNIRSDLQRHLPSFVRFLINYLLLHDVSFGALTQLYAGTMPEAVEHNGKYLIPWARVGTAAADCQNAELRGRLWEWLEGEVKGL